jgi:Sulfotransferase family
MPLCHNPAFIFIHIPKCAGTSITTAFIQAGCVLDFNGPAPLDVRLDFNVLWLHHTPARQLRTMVPAAEWKAALKFTVIRNPWDRLVSAFHFRKRHAPVYPPPLWNLDSVRTLIARPRHWHQFLMGFRPGFAQRLATAVHPGENFEQWLLRQMESNAQVFSCSHFICDLRGRILLDEVIRQEYLRSEFDRICRKLSIKAALPHCNPSERGDYRAYYTTYLRDLVRERFAEDIQRFDFTF